jgi:hypothetical protein
MDTDPSGTGSNLLGLLPSEATTYSLVCSHPVEMKWCDRSSIPNHP